MKYTKSDGSSFCTVNGYSSPRDNHQFTREPCRVIPMTVPRNEREQREELARLHTLEEARVAREIRESEAFNAAMRRFEALQRRTVWQRIKAMFGAKP